MRSRGPAWVIAAAVVASLLVACSASTGEPGRVTGSWSTRSSTAGPGPVTSAPARARLAWSDCRGGQCARLAVPIDDAAPDGPTFDLALLRVPARDPSNRIGSLLVNPGGPGASGVDLARAAAGFLPEAVRDRFDVVGWDPRGSGDSTPVDCGDRLDYLFSGNTAPQTTREWQDLELVSRRFAAACAQRSGALLAHLSTLDTVHDMERIRVALGDPKLTFLGFSYGTELGALYATLYPERVRALVLDGAVDSSLSAAESVIQQAEGLEHGLDEFFADCRAKSSCALHDDDPVAVYREVVAAVEREPITERVGDATRSLTPTELDIAVSAALYSERLWPQLARGLARARDGDARTLLELFDWYMSRASSGRYGNDWPSFLAITCLDGPSLGPPEAYPAVEAAAAARAPRFGPANVGLGLPCGYWPVPTAPPLPPVAAPSAPPIVVIGTTNDPVTPVQWARALVAQLGGPARLVVYDGQGHTSFGEGDPCLDDRIADYLVRLTLPPADLTCGSG